MISLLSSVWNSYSTTWLVIYAWSFLFMKAPKLPKTYFINTTVLKPKDSYERTIRHYKKLGEICLSLFASWQIMWLICIVTWKRLISWLSWIRSIASKLTWFFFCPVSIEPSGPPLNVQALTQSSTSILVKWSPPNELDRNGVITRYVVKYSSLSTEAFANTTDNATEILVTHLKKYATFSFTVRAVNEIGVGPPSVDDAKNTTFEDCKFVTKFISCNRARTCFAISFRISML